MRALIPSAAGEVDLHDHYAREWSGSGGLRVNFVCSVDGAVHAAGTSRGLQTPGDNAVFAALRDLADVVLAGAGTVTAERYRPAHPSPERRARRRELGYPETFPIAVTSRTLRLDPRDPLFTGADAAARTIVLTCAAADPVRRAELARVADVVDCGDTAVEPAAVRAELERRGHRRILSEGGPTAFAELAAAGVVDELCLSSSPVLAGPGAGRITAGDEWDSAVELDLHGLLAEESALFLRYRVRRGP